MLLCAVGEGTEQFLKVHESAGNSCYGLGIVANESVLFS